MPEADPSMDPAVARTGFGATLFGHPRAVGRWHTARPKGSESLAPQPAEATDCPPSRLDARSSPHAGADRG